MGPRSTPHDSTIITRNPDLVKIRVEGGRQVYQIRWVRRDQLLKYTNLLQQHKDPVTVQEDPRIFYYFTHWLSGRRIKKLRLGQMDLVAAWVLGDKYHAKNFQNILTLEMLRNFRRGSPVLPMHVGAAYKGPCNNGALRRLVTDMYCEKDAEELGTMQWTRFRKTCNKGFLNDVAERGTREEGTSAMRRKETYMV